MTGSLTFHESENKKKKKRKGARLGVGNSDNSICKEGKGDW